jgi:predicted secreted Zn-dependent protease
MRFFEYDHLPEHLKELSKPFCKLAAEVEKKHHKALMAENKGAARELEKALDKILEAKDCVVRSGV